MGMDARAEDALVFNDVKDDDDDVNAVVVIVGVTLGDIFIVDCDVVDEDSDAGDGNFMQI